MYPRIRNDECLICEGSLLSGIDLYRLLIEDVICFKCRKPLENKISIKKFMDYRLISFYKYNHNLMQLLVRYKDLLDVSLADVFLRPYISIINIVFKDYDIVLIPSSKTLKLRRGFNHLNLHLNKCKLNIIDCLKKEDDIQRFKQKRQDTKLSFKYVPTNLDKVIIFDDVITSGSSMQAAIKLLQPISNKIILITITTNLK